MGEMDVARINRVRGIQNLRKPLVSYIVPCYNKENYIEACLSSILCQDYPHIEIILVDDGSTDNSLGIALRVLGDQQGVNYRIVENGCNRGLGYSLFTGYRVAMGEFLCFLSADDMLIAPWKTSKQVEAMERDPALDITFFDSFETGHSRNTLDTVQIPFWQGWLLNWNTALFIFLLEGVNFIGSVSLMHRRRSYFALGEWDATLKNANDHDLLLKQVLNGAKIEMLNGNVVFYRDNPDQLSKDSQFNSVIATVEKKWIAEACHGDYPLLVKLGVKAFCRR